jgi:hypothetical protein
LHCPLQLPPDATLDAVERQVTAALGTAARRFNQKRPEIIVYPHEHDPRCVLAPVFQAAHADWALILQCGAHPPLL